EYLATAAPRLDDVAFTLATRPAFAVRASVPAESIAQAVEGLGGLEPASGAAGAAGFHPDGERIWLPPYPFQRREFPVEALS
ncbi:MAG TPA: hypothetical protein VFM37_01360, partial [Pseudonocardiaceae bacterium]|nr:hypothetical protein [Pseudonocardiaceae bacterium]